MDEHSQSIVNDLSCLIERQLRLWSGECQHPSSDADSSDDKIKTARKKIDTLRRIRGEVEDIMYGI